MFHSDIGVDDNFESTSRRSRGVCETANWPTATRGGFDRAKQTVRQGEVNSETITFLKRGMFCRIHCLFARFFLVCCLLHTVAFFPSCPQFSEAGTKKGDRSDWDVTKTVFTVPLCFFGCLTIKCCSFFDCALHLKWYVAFLGD